MFLVYRMATPLISDPPLSLPDEFMTSAQSIGLDTCLAIQKTLYEGTYDSKYRPSGLLERMVDAGWFGKKNGKGFYEYEG
jgi:3-hydroxyacyl-CoA dehydrogenase